MTVVGLVSVKHAPGVTTAAVALAVAAGDGALVVEADPAGGDVAARARLTMEPGLVTTAAAGRHPASLLNLRTQRLASGAEVVIAPADPEQTSAALATIADRLPAAVRERGGGFVDCGRWSPGTASTIVLSRCDVIVVVTDPSVAGIEHVRCRVDALLDIGPPVAALLIGDRPYPAREVERALAVKTIGALAVDSRGALSVYAGPPRLARRSALCRSARTALDCLATLGDLPKVRA
jgi:hypothetical protein